MKRAKHRAGQQADALNDLVQSAQRMIAHSRISGERQPVGSMGIKLGDLEEATLRASRMLSK